MIYIKGFLQFLYTAHANHATARSLFGMQELGRNFQIAMQFPKLHYLINNAGMIRDVTWNTFGRQTLERVESEDGHEIVMATNYLG